MKRNNFDIPEEKRKEIPPAPPRRASIPYFKGQKPPELAELEMKVKKEGEEDGVSEENDSQTNSSEASLTQMASITVA